MLPLSPASRVGSLRAAADHAQKATDQLMAMAGEPGISQAQRRRLRCLAACTGLASEGAVRLLLELVLP